MPRINPIAFNTFRIFGFAGTGLVILAVFYPALVYRGKRGEHYGVWSLPDLAKDQG